MDTGMQISQREFTTLYPIYNFVFEHLDQSRQSTVNIIFTANVGVGDYRALAVILSDKAMLMEGVGGRRKLDAPIENM